MKKTALFVAVEKENIEIIKLLLTNDKIDVNIINKTYYANGGGYESYWNYTALFKSIENENIEIIKLLLANEKIDVDSDNEKHIDYEGGGAPDEGNWHETPLFKAIELENIEIIKLLLAHKEIDIDIINIKEGKEVYDPVMWKKTALFKAVEIENVEIIKLLMTEYFDLNALNYDIGDEMYKLHDEMEITVLYLAVMRKNLKIINLLLTNLKNDINAYNLINKKETNVLDLANEIKDDEITKLLSDYKIKQSQKQPIEEGFKIFDVKPQLRYNAHPDLEITFKAEKFLNNISTFLMEKLLQKIETNDKKTIEIDDIEKVFSCLLTGEGLKLANKYVHSNRKFEPTITIDSIKNYIQKRINHTKINDEMYLFISLLFDFTFGGIMDISGDMAREHCSEIISLSYIYNALINDTKLTNSYVISDKFIPGRLFSIYYLKTMMNSL